MANLEQVSQLDLKMPRPCGNHLNLADLCKYESSGGEEQLLSKLAQPVQAVRTLPINDGVAQSKRENSAEARGRNLPPEMALESLEYDLNKAIRESSQSDIGAVHRQFIPASHAVIERSDEQLVATWKKCTQAFAQIAPGLENMRDDVIRTVNDAYRRMADLPEDEQKHLKQVLRPDLLLMDPSDDFPAATRKELARIPELAEVGRRFDTIYGDAFMLRNRFAVIERTLTSAAKQSSDARLKAASIHTEAGEAEVGEQLRKEQVNMFLTFVPANMSDLLLAKEPYIIDKMDPEKPLIYLWSK